MYTASADISQAPWHLPGRRLLHSLLDCNISSRHNDHSTMTAHNHLTFDRIRQSYDTQWSGVPHMPQNSYTGKSKHALDGNKLYTQITWSHNVDQANKAMLSAS